MRVKNLFKVIFVLLLLGTIFKVEYTNILHFNLEFKTVSSSSHTNPVPYNPEEPGTDHTILCKDVSRLEILFLFLFLLSFFAFFYRIFSFPVIRIYLPPSRIQSIPVYVKLNNKAPPFC